MKKILLTLVLMLTLLIAACSQKHTNSSSKPAPSPAPLEEKSSRDTDELLAEPVPVSPSPSSRVDGLSRLSSGSPSRPSTSGLKAGFADDNLQYNAYLDFLETYKKVPQIDFPVQERIILEVVDKNGLTLPDAVISVDSENGNLMRASTYADGRTLFFPAEYPAVNTYTVSITYNGHRQSFPMQREDSRNRRFILDTLRQNTPPVPVDILFILDTTGSMGEEIDRLKTTLLIIHDNIQSMSSPVDLRFGMVMYKDRGDEYITRKISFTDNASDFQKRISSIRAYGGGDEPEDMQSALEVSMKEMEWREKGVKLAYLITDAHAHLDYGQTFTLKSSSELAREKGIKIFSVGTGGLKIDGEINLRQIAQYTMGKYIFLTYGERGESDGGVPGSVSHHTGSNFTSQNLETIIIQFTKQEIADYSLQPVEGDEDYFSATKTHEEKTEILKNLFEQMITQLADYSIRKIPADTTVAVIPLNAGDNRWKANAEYFTEQLYHAAAAYRSWKSVDRANLQKIINEITLNLSGMVDPENAIKAGELAGANLLITGTVYEKDGKYEIYLSLVSAESGEVLSITRAYLDTELGL